MVVLGGEVISFERGIPVATQQALEVNPEGFEGSRSTRNLVEMAVNNVSLLKAMID